MEAIFSLIENNRLRTIKNLIGYLFASVGGQAMHEKRIRFGVLHQLAIDLIRPEYVVAASAMLLIHRYPAIGYDRIGIGHRCDGVLSNDHFAAIGIRPVDEAGLRL